MKWLPRCAAWSAVLAGGLGVLASLALLVGVWLVRARLDETTVAVHGRIDVALAHAQELSRTATSRVLGARLATEQLNREVRRKIARWRDESEPEMIDTTELQRELRARIDAGRDFFAAVESSVDLIEQLIALVRSSTHLGQDQPQTAGELVSALQAGKRELAKTQAMIDELGVRVAEFRTRRDVDRHAREIELLSQRIDQALAVVEESADRFSRKIDEVRAQWLELTERIRRALFLAAVTLTILLVWSIAAQACLAIQGRQYLRRAAS